MEYKPNRFKITFTIIFSLIIIFVGIMAILKYIPSVSSRAIAITSSMTIAIPSIVLLWIDYKSVIIVNDEYMHFIRSGKNIKVSWDMIGRIEYSNPIKLKPLDCMVIYTGQGKLYIDYTITDYIELWEKIILNYSLYGDEPNIDPVLLEYMNKHK